MSERDRSQQDHGLLVSIPYVLAERCELLHFEFPETGSFEGGDEQCMSVNNELGSCEGEC